MMFPEDMSYWKKGRIREKDADSSHYDDFYRYGDFGIEHDSDGSWEAYTIVGEKPILAKKGLHSFEEAVEYFRKELESKELKDKGDDKDCKMKDEEPEPPTNPEEDSSGMRLEIFLKSAEDMLSEYQGFTKAGTDWEQWHANGENDSKADQRIAKIYSKLFENNKSLDSSATKALLDKAYITNGPSNTANSRYWHTLRYMKTPFKTPAKYYKEVSRRQMHVPDDVKEGNDTFDKDNASKRFVNVDDSRLADGMKYRSEYNRLKRNLDKKSNRDVPRITDDMTWDMARRYLNRGFNPNYGKDVVYSKDPDTYLYEQFPQISGLLPDTKTLDDSGETVFSGAPRNPFHVLRRTSYKTDEQGNPILDAKGKPVRINGEPILDENGNPISVLNLKNIAYHTPTSETMVNRSIRTSHTPTEKVFDDGEIDFPPTYAKTAEEAVQGMLDDPDIYPLLKTYYGLMRDKSSNNLERQGMIDDWSNNRRDVEPGQAPDPKDPQFKDKQDEYEAKLKEYEAKVKKYEDQKKAHSDELKENEDFSKEYSKLIRHIYGELNRKAEDYLKKNASMRVYYDIMKNGANVTTDNGATFQLPIRYVPMDIDSLSYVPSTLDNRFDNYPKSIARYVIPENDYVSAKDSDLDTFFHNMDEKKAKKKAEAEANAGPKPEPKFDDRKDIKTGDDVRLMNKLEGYKHENPSDADNVIGTLTKEGRIGYDSESGKYSFPNNRSKKDSKEEKPKTEKAEKSMPEDRSAEDILNEWSSGNVHLIREPWKSLVLDAGSKESDPLKIHDDSGNIMFDLRHQ